MGKEIGQFYKHNQSKISTPTLKKPDLLSSASHTNMQVISRLDNKHITTN